MKLNFKLKEKFQSIDKKINNIKASLKKRSKIPQTKEKIRNIFKKTKEVIVKSKKNLFFSLKMTGALAVAACAMTGVINLLQYSSNSHRNDPDRQEYADGNARILVFPSANLVIREEGNKYIKADYNKKSYGSFGLQNDFSCEGNIGRAPKWFIGMEQNNAEYRIQNCSDVDRQNPPAVGSAHLPKMKALLDRARTPKP